MHLLGERHHGRAASFGPAYEAGFATCYRTVLKPLTATNEAEHSVVLLLWPYCNVSALACVSIGREKLQELLV